MPSTTADGINTLPDPNNDDARSTSSTLVSGEGKQPDEENEAPVNSPAAEQVVDTFSTMSLNDPISNVRHGFDEQVYEEELIRFMYYTEKRHDSNGQPAPVVVNTLQDWVKFKGSKRVRLVQCPRLTHTLTFGFMAQ
jgi:regulator-associated protein of mTOR